MKMENTQKKNTIMNEEGGLRKGTWTAEEDALLKQCVQTYGEGNWFQVPARAGLNRSRKSCRLRWLNYLKPGINRGELQEDEVDLILRLQKLLGNKWSLIAGRLPGRTSNDIKNYWYTHIAKKSAEPSSSQGKQQQDKEEDVAVKVKAIRPIARRPTAGGKHFCMNNEGSSSDQLQHPPENEVNYWWDGFGGGCSATEGHCTTAVAANHMQIDSPWAVGDNGFADDAGGNHLDDDGELCIDDIFQL